MMHASQEHSTQATTRLNVGAERVAKVYAQAIIEAADRNHCRREVLDELAGIVRDVLPAAPKARAVFASPRVTPEEKAAIIDRMAKGRVLPTTLHTLQVLARHDENYMPPEAAHALEQAKKSQGSVVAPAGGSGK